ncbi:hypothetical protein SDRG_04439 [Saprolegnia diclina VS20]|uniref:EF-hand domain-containing protein n=1 Tax=Saprolegnia diclina (strain VS20) TaxID=1156394 RepID=T0QJ45_SAPDV|nr:hypothetical protein SDRG_04439 [Saprolegnia diclina VS20]EQC38009.1 hypothetical protein SDRG_04439 [Saprolegnia diclina VS20]|eukprot:XP_008608336.1 hypothetical protein SDRG_04439 [Saprolegnia diclina VS20]
MATTAMSSPMHVKVHWDAVDQSSLLYAYLADIFYDDGTGEMDPDDVRQFVHELVDHAHQEGDAIAPFKIDDVIASLEDPRSHRVRLQSLVHVLQTS